MIVLKKLYWSNAFSYGEEESSIDFSDSRITQLLGKNGDGKSSIALLLEEILYNKNSKGIKKKDICNRYTDSNKYYIKLSFTKGADEYFIESKRASTQVVTLTCNGEDISSHTATSTYKLIEQIIGMDHKTFAQLVYQSHSRSLEFLVSADTARKKFLIDLLNLAKYIDIGNYFKDVVRDIGKEVSALTSKVNTIQAWVTKNSQYDLEVKELFEVPEINTTIQSDISALQLKKRNIQQINAKITKNNTYGEMLEVLRSKNTPAPQPESEDTSPLITRVAELKKEAKDAQAMIDKFVSLDTVCPTCLSEISKEKVDKIVVENTEVVNKATNEASKLSSQLTTIKESIALYKKYKDNNSELEKYYNMFDASMETEMVEADDLDKEISKLERIIKIEKAERYDIEQKNSEALAHNTKVEVILSQLVEMQSDLKTAKSALEEAETRRSTLEILSKTFSTSGLVAYKIESLIVDLEKTSNRYLSELSDGRFQISFQISGNDKLNVVIGDNGKDIDIHALSAGETARVNVAVLLAIRSITNSMYSDAQINLLFLDETIATLDTEGKERLVEVLLNEKTLNTVLVSHDYQHPLIDKMVVTKVDNISTITKD